MSQNVGWCVVISKPMAEEVAEASIRNAGYMAYLPRSARVIRGRVVDGAGKVSRPRGERVMRPAFRGYLFFELHPDQRWRHLADSRETNGVQRIMTRGDEPIRLAPEVIDAVRQLENAGEFDDPVGLRNLTEGSKRRTDISPGDVVRLTEGPFALFLAELQDQDDLGRATVLGNMLGRIVRVKVEARTLERVDA